MAKANQESNEQVQAAPAAGTISTAELQAILAAVVAQGDQRTQAIIEALQNPRKDKNEEALKDQFRELDRQAQADKVAATKARQEACPHFQGSNELSDVPGPLTSIIHHTLDSGERIGICTNCQRVWRPGDADYVQQMNRKTGNQPSMAGQRFVTRTFAR